MVSAHFLKILHQMTAQPDLLQIKLFIKSQECCRFTYRQTAEALIDFGNAGRIVRRHSYCFMQWTVKIGCQHFYPRQQRHGATGNSSIGQGQFSVTQMSSLSAELIIAIRLADRPCSIRHQYHVVRRLQPQGQFQHCRMYMYPVSDQFDGQAGVQ